MPLGMFWALNILLAGISSALLAVLLVIYGRNAAQIRSKFAIGLIVFAALFLVQNLAGMWIYMSMNDALLGANVAVPMLVLNATETGALGTLVAISWE
jgi:dipeptide/tripeptide permease